MGCFLSGNRIKSFPGKLKLTNEKQGYIIGGNAVNPKLVPKAADGMSAAFERLWTLRDVK